MKKTPFARSSVIVLTALLSAVVLSACTTASEKTSAAPSSDTSAASEVAVDSKLHDRLPASIRDAGKLTFGTDPTYAPFEFYDTDNTTIIGADADLAAALGDVLGVKIEYTKSSFSSLLPSLTAGRFDAAISAIGDYKERENVGDFVNYYLGGRAFLSQEDGPRVTALTDLCGRSVGVLQGTDAQEKAEEVNPTCDKQSLPAVKVRAFPTQDAAVLALTSGRVDNVFSDTATTGWSAAQTSGLVSEGSTLYGDRPHYGIVVPKGSELSPVLGDAINALIESGQYESILKKWGLSDGAIPEATFNAATE